MYAFRPQQDNLPVRRPAVHKQPKGTSPKPKSEPPVPNMRPYSFAASVSESNVSRYTQDVPAVPQLPALPKRAQAQAHTYVKPQSNATPRPVPTKSYSLFPPEYSKPAQAPVPAKAKTSTPWDSTKDWKGKKAADPFNTTILANNSIMRLQKALYRLQTACQSQINSAPRSRGGFFSSLFRRSKRSHSVPTVPESRRLELMSRIVEISAMQKRLRQAEDQLGDVITGRAKAETVSQLADPYFALLIRSAEVLIGQLRFVMTEEQLREAGIL